MRFPEEYNNVKGQAEIIEAVVYGMVVLMVTGFATSAFWTVFQQTSDEYVEKEKYENAQSKISELQGTIDRKDQRIDNLEDWKENYSKVKRENERLEEQVNQSESQQEPEIEIEPPNINIEYPWGVSVVALIGLIIGIITPTSVVGIKGYIKVPVPETVAAILEEGEDTENGSEKRN